MDIRKQILYVLIFCYLTSIPLLFSNSLPKCQDYTAVTNATYSSIATLAKGSKEAQLLQKKLVAKGYPLEIETKIGKVKMRLIPAGQFIMGSPPHEKERMRTERRHWVTIAKPFYMGVFEITQKQWQAVMGESLKDCMNRTTHQELVGEGERYPIYYVSWEDAQKFVKKLCQLSGVPEGTYRLPTEAQWEYACRAGTNTVFYFGNSLSPDQANFSGRFPYNTIKGIDRKSTVEVGSFKPNAWGLYDMHGNVWEWCLDNFERFSSESVTDPIINKNNTFRVYRGGCWYRLGSCCRSANRNGYQQDYRNSNVGFRIIRIIKQTE